MSKLQTNTRIPVLRESRGLSQKDLAHAMGVHPSTISRAERLDRTAMMDTYIRCAKLLKVPLAALFDDGQSADEQTILSAYRAMSPDRQAGWLDLANVILASHSDMKSVEVDAGWIKARLSNRWGERTALAKAMGIDPPKLSRILSGQRAISQLEATKARQFFTVR